MRGGIARAILAAGCTRSDCKAPVDVSGAWRGEVRDTRGERLAVELRFAQSGTAIGGSYAIGERSGTLYGLRIGARVEFDTEPGSRGCGGRPARRRALLRGLAGPHARRRGLRRRAPRKRQVDARGQRGGRELAGRGRGRGHGQRARAGGKAGMGGSAGMAGSGDCIEGTPGACTIAICGSRRCPLPFGTMAAGRPPGVSACCSGPERCGIGSRRGRLRPRTLASSSWPASPMRSAATCTASSIRQTRNGVGCCRTTDGLCGVGLR